jgi:hypothetical protein
VAAQSFPLLSVTLKVIREATQLVLLRLQKPRAQLTCRFRPEATEVRQTDTTTFGVNLPSLLRCEANPKVP